MSSLESHLIKRSPRSTAVRTPTDSQLTCSWKAHDSLFCVQQVEDSGEQSRQASVAVSSLHPIPTVDEAGFSRHIEVLLKYDHPKVGLLRREHLP